MDGRVGRQPAKAQTSIFHLFIRTTRIWNLSFSISKRYKASPPVINEIGLSILGKNAVKTNAVLKRTIGILHFRMKSPTGAKPE